MDVQGLIAERLGALLAVTRAVYEIAHSFHWRTAGPAYYADHLMFERIYGDVYGLIDPLAEKLIGMSAKAGYVEAGIQAQATANVIKGLPQPKDAAEFPVALLAAETSFLQSIQAVLDELLDALEAAQYPSAGLENFLQGMADLVEVHVYLLQQRATA